MLPEYTWEAHFYAAMNQTLVANADLNETGKLAANAHTKRSSLKSPRL